MKVASGLECDLSAPHTSYPTSQPVISGLKTPPRKKASASFLGTISAKSQKVALEK